MLAGLSILIAMVSGSTLSSAERVAQLRQRVEFETNAYGARAQLLYWVSATSATKGGFSDGVQQLRADNVPYAMAGGSTMALQDVGGMISLNKPNEALLRRYLQVCGVDDAVVPALVDTLQDYTDADDLRRLNGAEHRDYEDKGLRGPRNAPLRNVTELWSVLGWSEWQPLLQKNGCIDDFTVEISLLNSINLATASSRVLEASGLSPETAAMIVQSRSNPILLAAQLQSAGIGANDMFGLSGGSVVQRKLVVTHRQVGSPWSLRYTLLLTAEKDDRPWNIVEPRWSASAVAAAETPPTPATSKLDSPSDSRPGQLLPWPDNPAAAQSNNAKNPFSF